MLLTNFLKGLRGSKYLKTNDAGQRELSNYIGFRIYKETDEDSDALVAVSSDGRTIRAYNMQEMKNSIDKNIASRKVPRSGRDAAFYSILSKDGPPNYYDMIVIAARELKNPFARRDEVRKRIENVLAHWKIPFDEAAFKTAFSEFRTAGANRMVYGKS